MNNSRFLQGALMVGMSALTLQVLCSVSTAATHPKRFAPGTMFQPDSDFLPIGPTKILAHTNLRLIVPRGQPSSVRTPTVGAGATPAAPPVSGEFYETPQSLQCMYGISTVQSPGCNPNTITTTTLRGSKAIAIVDAYDYPAAQSDLATFSSQFGLPAPTSSSFQVVYASGTQPPDGSGTGWDLEAALDIEMAHSMAPKATIYLVEATSNSFSDLQTAVLKASQLVSAAGGGEVSMSYGGPEYSGETSLDSGMTTNSVVYFASSGDSPGTEYPCVSPNVVCVGGTTDSRSTATGKWEGESAWSDTGGGSSTYEVRPSFQGAVAGIVGSKRGVPDIAAVADPNTGVWVYNSTYDGSGLWFIVGGTSVASPLMAAFTNAAGHFYPSSAVELKVIYSTVGATNAGWSDVASGACGFYAGNIATSGWDFCTGVGTPRGLYYKVVTK